MNKIVLKHTGDLQINGVDVRRVSGFRIQTDDDGNTTATVQFGVDGFDIEVSAEDFRTNNLPLRATS
jgi:hypothetical protein